MGFVMRFLLIGTAALLLAGCGGEKYPMASSRAYSTLASVGTPAGLYPLPGVLSQVEVRFESMPAQNAVQWIFTHDGDDLGRIVATVAPSGNEASTVSIDYVDGTASDANWHNKEVRDQLKSSIRELVVEAVDSGLENRSFDMALHDRIETAVTAATIGSTMADVGKRLMSDDKEADYE